jgi:iron-sulfur cluster assembly protein
MINITSSAAEQIRKSAEQGQSQGMCLRVAVRLGEQNEIEYGMGFDERHDDDIHFVTEGIDVVVTPGARELLTGATLDYVEINPGEFQFIFHNPNDPSHTKPRTDS